jgi:DNA-binding PadR family transcriptional regulator
MSKHRQLEDRRSPAIPAGELMLSRLLHHGWIESRGEKQHTAIRLTPAGLKAMRSPI